MDSRGSPRARSAANCINEHERSQRPQDRAVWASFWSLLALLLIYVQFFFGVKRSRLMAKQKQITHFTISVNTFHLQNELTTASHPVQNSTNSSP